MGATEIVITGAGGMLGTELVRACERYGRPVEPFDSAEAFDITDAAAVVERLHGLAPRVVINAAAYTDVDGAETETAAADAVNRAGPANLARACAANGALLVHYSTDYVFNGRGDRPYPPDAPTDPVNAYGRTKLDGEQAIRRSGAADLILRTSWLYASHHKNFVRTIHRLASEGDELQVVDDQRGRPTNAADLAEATLKLIDVGARGTLHVTNDGECTWCDLAREIVALAGLDCDVQPCDSSAFPRPAARPAYSVLDLAATTNLIGPTRHWREALAECIARMTSATATTPADTNQLD